MRSSLGIGLGLAGLAFALAATAAPPPVEPVLKAGGPPVLFVDDSAVSVRERLVRTVHSAQTLDAPVIEPDRAWEGERVYVYGSVYRDPTTGEYRLWYLGRAQPEGAEQPEHAPDLREGGFDVVLYATSADGLHWLKPELGLHAFDGSRANNIVHDLHSPAVLVDPFEDDPTQRYKMMGATMTGYVSAHSADGLNWEDYPGNPVLPHYDTVTLTQDPRTGEYLVFHKRPAVVRGFPRRVVWLSRSRDFRTWSEPELVFAPDAVDDEWATRRGERTEVYNMAVIPHATGFIGFPTIFRMMAETPRDQVLPGQSPLNGPIDVQMVTSRDGRTWQRTWPRQNVIPRGAPGAFDAGAILGVSSTTVDDDAGTHLYYTGLTTGHGGPMPPKRISIGRATWRRHGFVSLDAGPEGGWLETVPLRFASPELVVNADASRGELRVALREVDGRPVPGYDFEDMEAVSADVTRQVVRWSGGGRLPLDRPLRIAVELSNGRLFSLEVAGKPIERGAQ